MAAKTKTVQEIVTLNIRRLRKGSGLTQAELETRSGIPLRTLSRIQNQPSNISLETLDILAKSLDVPITEFFKSPNIESLGKRKFDSVESAINFIIEILEDYKNRAQ